MLNISQVKYITMHVVLRKHFLFSMNSKANDSELKENLETFPWYYMDSTHSSRFKCLTKSCLEAQCLHKKNANSIFVKKTYCRIELIK